MYQYFEALQVLVKQYLVTNEDEPMQQVLGKLLLSKNKTVSTAESCTGGYIAHLLSQKPGASAYYAGSVVCPCVPRLAGTTCLASAGH